MVLRGMCKSKNKESEGQIMPRLKFYNKLKTGICFNCNLKTNIPKYYNGKNYCGICFELEKLLHALKNKVNFLTIEIEDTLLLAKYRRKDMK